MKINLEGKLRNGYLNISSNPPKIDENSQDCMFAIGDYRKLIEVFPDKAEEIIFNPPINIIVPTSMVDIMTNWKDRLTNSGSLKMSYIDITDIGNRIAFGNAEIEEIHNMVFGPNYSFRGIIDTPVIRSIAQELGFTVNGIVSSGVMTYMELLNDSKD